MFRTLVYVLIDSCWILLIGIVLVSVSPTDSGGADAPSTISYIATGETCCGEDPHPVHGVATSDGGFVLVGKSLDLEEEWQGFVVKFPPNLPTGTLWLEPGEEFSYQWSYSFGSNGKKDGANSVAANKDSVFVAGFITNSSGLIDRYLAKLDLISGNLIWNVTFPSKHSSGESAFESIQLTKDGGLIATGFVAGNKGELEGYHTNNIIKNKLSTNKTDGLLKYNYSIALENYPNDKIISEKFTDCILCWCMPIYWGNNESIRNCYPTNSYHLINIENNNVFEEIQKIISSIPNEKNIKALEKARNLILDKLNIWEYIYQIINNFESLIYNYKHTKFI